MDLLTTLQIIGGIIVIVSFGFGIVRYLLDKDESSEKELRSEFHKTIDGIRKEISDIKENHVKRDDHARHAESVERQIRDVSTMVSNMSTSINVRLDNLFAVITGGVKK